MGFQETCKQAGPLHSRTTLHTMLPSFSIPSQETSGDLCPGTLMLERTSLELLASSCQPSSLLRHCFLLPAPCSLLPAPSPPPSFPNPLNPC
eukprot:750495-Hanusia_phi.AAC.1